MFREKADGDLELDFLALLLHTSVAVTRTTNAMSKPMIVFERAASAKRKDSSELRVSWSRVYARIIIPESIACCDWESRRRI